MPATLPSTDTEQLEAYALAADAEANAAPLAPPTAKSDRMGYLLVAPYLLLLIVFFGYPLLFSLVLIFHRWDVVTPMEFVGLKNFVRLFQDDLFFRSILNTGLFLAIHIPLQIGVALFFAELLNTKLPGRGFFRTIYFLPVVVSGVVVTILFQQLFAYDTGFINDVLTAMGGDRVPWLVSPTWAMPSIALMATWKNVGLYVILFLAGLQNIPASLYEVADIEGASAWQRWRWVTLPMLNPMLVTVVVLSTIAILSGAALGGLHEATRELAENNVLKFKKIPAVVDLYGWGPGTRIELPIGRSAGTAGTAGAVGSVGTVGGN